MSTASSAGSEPTRWADRAEVQQTEKGHHWVTFAGTMLMIVGTLNVIYGIAAIDDAHVYAANTSFVFADLNTWGWFLTILGSVQFLAAFSIWNQTEWGRWVGILSASGNAMLMLLFLPAAPFLTLCLFAIDVLVIYGLVSYGGRHPALD